MHERLAENAVRAPPRSRHANTCPRRTGARSRSRASRQSHRRARTTRGGRRGSRSRRAPYSETTARVRSHGPTGTPGVGRTALHEVARSERGDALGEPVRRGDAVGVGEGEDRAAAAARRRRCGRRPVPARRGHHERPQRRSLGDAAYVGCPVVDDDDLEHGASCCAASASSVRPSVFAPPRARERRRRQREPAGPCGRSIPDRHTPARWRGEGAAAATPRITALVPVKDRRERMLRCLDALLAQDHPDYEIVVLDNGSTDGTPEACLERRTARASPAGRDDRRVAGRRAQRGRAPRARRDRRVHRQRLPAAARLAAAPAAARSPTRAWASSPAARCRRSPDARLARDDRGRSGRPRRFESCNVVFPARGVRRDAGLRRGGRALLGGRRRRLRDLP